MVYVAAIAFFNSKRTEQRHRAKQLAQSLSFLWESKSVQEAAPEIEINGINPRPNNVGAPVVRVHSNLQSQVASGIRQVRPMVRILRNLDTLPYVVPDSDLSDEDDSTFEQDFLKVVVRRGLGRTIVNELLAVFRKHNKGDFPKDARTCLGSISVVSTIEIFPGRYHHFGLFESLNRILKFSTIRNSSDVIKIQINIDGLPLSRSSQSSFWPILGKVVSPIVSKVFLIGLYFGEKKPESVHQFLDGFIEDCVKAANEGITVAGIHHDLVIDSVVCDAPARQFIKCITGHTGYYACERCVIRGKYLEKKGVRFSETDCATRSDESYRNRENKQHHARNQVSPFCSLSLDMVRCFPLDYMHLVLLGVVRKVVKSFLGLKGGVGITCAKLSRSQVSRINIRQLMFSKSVPQEFQRRPRSFRFAPLFKATEFRMFLCYISPAVLLRIYPKKVFVYQHFMLLVVAIRILLSPSQPKDSVKFAQNCLRVFVEFAPNIYGKAIHVYNVHCLIHLVDDYEKYGALDNISSFPYESYLGMLKSYVKRPGQELEQVVKRLHEENNFILDGMSKITKETVKLNREHFNGPLGDYSDKPDVKQFSEVIYFGRVFRLNSRNSAVFWNGRYCKICNILQVGRQIVFLIKLFKGYIDVFKYPCKSSCVGICFVDRRISRQLINVHVSEVVKCWLTEWNDQFYYVVKLLHENK